MSTGSRVRAAAISSSVRYPSRARSSNVWCGPNRRVRHSRKAGPPPARARSIARAAASYTISGSWPSTVSAGMPNASARPVMLPAPATGIVVA